jgi:class 3 adenylate cyclase
VAPKTQYARRGDVHLAYQVVGDGDLDVVFVPSWFSHVEGAWEIGSFSRFLGRLSSFGRLICFDKYGIGLSDPAPPGWFPPLEEWMDDVRTVMDAAGSERAALIGTNEGGLMAALFAATYPERTISLVLANTSARIAFAPDYPFGLSPEARDQLVRLVEETWGTAELMTTISPSVAGDTAALEGWARFFRMSASPSTAAAVIGMLYELDIRGVIPSIQVPTLVLHRRHARLLSADNGRYLAQAIPGARYVELPGEDYGVGVGDVDAMVGEMQEFLVGHRQAAAPDRMLATVLFTDIVGSTRRAAELGDQRWRDVLDAHDALARRQIARYEGRYVDPTGDGLMATFEGPARAIRCATAIRNGVRGLGLDIRAGLHTGELERRGDNVAGICVHIAARIQELAEPGQVLVSRTVKDLVAGSGIEFEPRGSHHLHGVDDDWQVYAARCEGRASGLAPV